MATPLPRLLNLLPCGCCGGAHSAFTRVEGMHVLHCGKAKDNGLYLYSDKAGRPYLVTGPIPERKRDGRKG